MQRSGPPRGRGFAEIAGKCGVPRIGAGNALGGRMRDVHGRLAQMGSIGWLLMSLAASGCAVGGAAGGDEARRGGPAAVDGKADSPYGAAREACLTSFDCEVGLECGEDGTCQRQPTSCGSEP